MKNVGFILGIISVVLISISPSFFRNDYIKLLDVVVVALSVLGFFYNKILNTQKFIYWINSFTGFLYSVTAISSNDELNFRMNRIEAIFFIKNKYLESPVIEVVSWIAFIIFFITALFIGVYFSLFLFKHYSVRNSSKRNQ